MKIDVDVNMTLEVEESDWEDFLEQYAEEDEDGELIPVEDPEQYLDEFVDEVLNGEEVSTYYGRAWVCSVDNAGIIERG